MEGARLKTKLSDNDDTSKNFKKAKFMSNLLNELEEDGGRTEIPQQSNPGSVARHLTELDSARELIHGQILPLTPHFLRNFDPFNKVAGCLMDDD